MLWAGIVLNFEKTHLDYEYVNEEFIQTFKLLILCLISPLNGLIVVWAAMVLKFEKQLKPMNNLRFQHSLICLSL